MWWGKERTEKWNKKKREKEWEREWEQWERERERKREMVSDDILTNSRCTKGAT